MATIVSGGPPWQTPSPVTPTAPPLAGRTLLDQHWRDLTFLHWRVDPERVAPLLPPQIRPDVYDGSSWVGLIPFRLTDAGFGRGPALPYLGSFPETNVRFYSVDAAGRRGVVFGSLESARLAFVLGARWTLGLNYTWARMRIQRHGEVISYSSRRRWPGPRGVRTASQSALGQRSCGTIRWLISYRALGTPHPPVRPDLLPAEYPRAVAAGHCGTVEPGRRVARRRRIARSSTVPPDSVLFSPGVHTRFGAPPRRQVG